MSFPVICGTPRGSSRLGRYGFVKLEAPKNGKESPSWLQVFNERVKWLQQENYRSHKLKEKSYPSKV